MYAVCSKHGYNASHFVVTVIIKVTVYPDFQSVIHTVILLPQSREGHCSILACSQGFLEVLIPMHENQAECLCQSITPSVMKRPHSPGKLL